MEPPPSKDEFLWLFMFSLLYAWGNYYASFDWDQNLPIKNTGEEDAEMSDLICKQMHMKNNANQNCLMLQSEILIQVVMEAIYCIYALIIMLNMIQM